MKKTERQSSVVVVPRRHGALPLLVFLRCFVVFWVVVVVVVLLVDHHRVHAYAPPPSSLNLRRAQQRPRLPQKKLLNNNMPAAAWWTTTSPAAAAPSDCCSAEKRQRRIRRRGFSSSSSSLIPLRLRRWEAEDDVDDDVDSFDGSSNDDDDDEQSCFTLATTTTTTTTTTTSAIAAAADTTTNSNTNEKDAAAAAAHTRKSSRRDATSTLTTAAVVPPFLTPYNLLHPASFPLTAASAAAENGDEDPSINHNDDDNHNMNGHETVRSLHAVLGLFRQSLQRIVDCSSDSPVAEQLRRATSYSNSNSMLRIEHRLDHNNVDALAWLRAQQPFFVNQQQQDDIIDTTTTRLYLQTWDRLEAACVGAAVVVKRTPDLFCHKYSSNLPQNTQWYGGARFDSHSNSKNDTSSADAADNSKNNNEWQAFGAAHWIIPAVELVRRRGEDDDGSWEATLAVHLVADDDADGDPPSFQASARRVLQLLERLTPHTAPAGASTTTRLPPILSRDQDGPEEYEQAVARALEALEENQQQPQQSLQKVVLARRQRLRLQTPLNVLDVLARWKYGSGHRDEGGHLFWMQLLDNGNNVNKSENNAAVVEFFGCTPERLFAVTPTTVASEALAGTRPRGSTQEADAALLKELMTSSKDWRENQLTASYITSALDRLHAKGWVTAWNGNDRNNQKQNISDKEEQLELSTTQISQLASSSSSGFFVRRLRHVQHICQRYSAKLIHDDENNSSSNKQYNSNRSLDIARFLLTELHPTPAVCGLPMQAARDFIRQHESISFDRGFYAGPFGYIGRDNSEILVAIRSALAVTPRSGGDRSGNGGTTISSYAGAGLVRGSTLEAEWSEINYKFAVIASLFPQSPVTLRSAPTPNVAWCAAWVEELLRHGVTRFYVCPGSRSTPLVAAVARAVRANTGVVHAVSVHDERAAGFRAVGYAKGCGQPAAVITSSGTAVSNLYPAVVEAGMDGVPLLLLTADRPYEARATGANQAIDQVKTFGETYVRWFRDVLPPSDDVSVSVALSDAGHAADLARQLRGPVHVNLQFRENLAPEAGPIRNDNRIGSFTKFDGMRFTDVPGFARWSNSGGKWSSSYSTMSGLVPPLNAVQDVARLIEQSQRGIIVVGNLRTSTSEIHKGDQRTMVQAISDFAKAIGFPIFAGAQSANLRFSSSAVVPFAEHLLKCPIVSENLRPDLIIQIGAPLVSTAVPSVIASAMKADDSAGKLTTSHVLLHPHFPHERADPEFTVTHKINAEISPFLNDVADMLSTNGVLTSCSSRLAPLVLLGRIVQPSIKSLIHEATESVILDKGWTLPMLSEPEVTVAMSEVFAESVGERSMFLSNSMPIRDAEFFFYPFSPLEGGKTARGGGPASIGTNRGASGIDGIISSALGFLESTQAPTTLLIGDLATLHDIGSLHSVANNALIHKNAHHNNKHLPLTTVIINNDGGGIFSFLPIAKHGKDVAFDEFFGTPTSSFSFEKGAEAFGLPCEVASDYETFRSKYEAAAELGKDSIVEARVVDRSTNVVIHRKITRGVEYYVTSLLFRKPQAEKPIRLPVKVYCRPTVKQSLSAAGEAGRKTLVLLHGWMGDKLEWDETANILCDKLGDSEWTILSVDLPGHGSSPYETASGLQALRSALYLDEDEGETEEADNLSIDSIALSVLTSLSKHHGIEKINAIAGYSLGGRVALAMKRLCFSKSVDSNLVDLTTAMVILGANVGDLSANALSMVQEDDDMRKLKDDTLAAELTTLSDKLCVTGSESEARAAVDSILDRWYSAELWGALKQNSTRYSEMIEKRSKSLRTRGRDLARVMSQSSPPRNQKGDWRYCTFESTLFISGGLDKKYSTIGMNLKGDRRAQFETIDDVGHALLVEAPSRVANMLADFLSSDYTEPLPREEEVETDADSTESLVKMQAAIPEPSAVVTKKIAEEEVPLWSTRADSYETLDAIEYESFSIDLVDGEQNRNGISGIGWGDSAAATTTNVLSSRSGFIIELRCVNGLEVGLGEISPLSGLHGETLDQAKNQLVRLQTFLQQESPENLPEFETEGILTLDGSLNNLLAKLERRADLAFFPSVRSGLEMALLSLAAQKVGLPIHQAMSMQSISEQKQTSSSTIPVSGLITRHTTIQRSRVAPSKSFPSVKVKVGHQNLAEDSKAMLRGFQLVQMCYGKLNGRVRADANRAWNESQAIEFATMLEGIDVHAIEKVEFIEEPLKQIKDETGEWSFAGQVEALERSYQHTGILYALDESLADLAAMNGWCFENMKKDIESAFKEGRRGCAVFILKPALLGLELSLQLARLARTDLGIGAVFSSSFDSGLGLAYTSFLGHVSDQIRSAANVYPHGVGTFTMLDVDTISPPFESYVNNDGFLNTASLSRALYGLSLDEIRESQAFAPLPPERLEPEIIDEAYESATATSTSGNQISVVVSLPLPFSAETACSRFTDLPSMSRWSPWISSVQYQGTETEWTINVRGIPLKWRAKSELIDDPFPGIQWQSVSGLNNRGVVEFVADESSNDPANNCNMNVRMTIVTPRILRPLFEGTSLFVEEFLRDKLLKWSLEMFRDSVKADLALERGDVELGDALIGAVEGKASAIEATLNSGPAVNGDQEQ